MFTRKAAYTIPELANLTGLSRYRMARLLRSNQVPMRKNGRTGLVFVSELKKAMPEMWDSIMALQANPS